MDRRDVLSFFAFGTAAAALPGCATHTTTTAGKNTRPLWGWTATELRSGLARGDFSAVEVTRSVLERIETVNPKINAVVAQFGDEAIAAASLADARKARREPLPPLHGIPITIKVNTDYAGYPTTNGVVSAKNLIAKEDAAVVRNLKRGGAIVVGHTNVPAFSYRWFSNNDLHGATLNPFDPKITPGGSSGGAAAAVAVGMGAVGHGTDIAGSVRYPAFACGVAGIRPTPGTAPHFNPSQPNSARPMMSQLMSVHGLMARSVADLRMSFPSFASVDHRDVNSTPIARSARSHTRKPRIAVMREHADYASDREVGEGIGRAMVALREAGCTVEEAAPPAFAEMAELWSSIVLTEVRRGFQQAIDKSGDRRTQTAVRTWLEITPDLSLDAYIGGLSKRERLAREWRVFLNQYDALVLPSSWMNPFAFDLDQQGPEVFRKIIRAQSPQLAVAIAGVPGLSVPTGVVNGIPTGVQVVADRYREETCFDVGELIEQQLGVITPIDPRPARQS